MPVWNDYVRSLHSTNDEWAQLEGVHLINMLIWCLPHLKKDPPHPEEENKEVPSQSPRLQT